MPSNINTYARGLLGLLDAKIAGRAPAILGDTIQMTLDTFPFYIAQKQETIQSLTAAVAGAGFINPLADFTVPEGEIWFVDHFAAIASTALVATEFLGFQMAFEQQSAAGGRSMLLGPQLVAGATVPVQPAAYATRPFLALPGNRLQALIYHRAVYVGTLSFRASILRMPI